MACKVAATLLLQAFNPAVGLQNAVTPDNLNLNLIQDKVLIGENLTVARPKAPFPICFGANGTDAECIEPSDANQCTPGAAKKTAIAFSFDQYIEWKFDEAYYKKKKVAADSMGSDLVLLLPAEYAPEDFKLNDDCKGVDRMQGNCMRVQPRIPIPHAEMKIIEKYFKVVRTPWIIPPGLSPKVPREGGCCGAREFMKLNALGLTEYDAVVNLDTDFDIIGSLQSLFDCAASGRFLSARGSMSGVNGGMFAVKPNKQLLYDIIIDLTSSTASDEDGWNMMGTAPGTHKAYASGGLQGFLYYYFYQRGANIDAGVTAGQVQPCDWTGAIFCDPDKACAVTPLLHKLECPGIK